MDTVYERQSEWNRGVEQTTPLNSKQAVWRKGEEEDLCSEIT